MPKPALWTKNFVVVSVANFFLYFTFYLLMVTMTLYAADRFHASASQAGFASGIFVIGTLIARLVCGRLVDQTGPRLFLYAGFALFLLTTLLYLWADSMAMLLADRFLNGAAMGMASTATGTIASRLIPNERRGEGTGYYGLSLTAAAAAGPFTGMIVSARWGSQASFAVCAAILSASFLAVAFVRIPAGRPREKRAGRGLSPASFLAREALPISVFAILIALCYSSVLSFVSAYVKSLDLVSAGSFFFVAYSATVLASRPFTGKWFDSKGENFVMYPALVLFALAMAVLGAASGAAMILAAGALVGLGYGTLSSSVQAISVKVTPGERMGLAVSTIFIFLDIGIGFGPFLLGFLVPSLGYRNLYLCGAALLVLALPCYHVLHGRKAARS